MLKDSRAYSGYSVNDLDAARTFYREVLGVETDLNAEGLELKLGSGSSVFVYPKPNHRPATFTVLNFPVEDLETSVDELVNRGVTFEHYDFGEYSTDERGILDGKAAGMGPKIAWFKDPAGNILSLIGE